MSQATVTFVFHGILFVAVLSADISRDALAFVCEDLIEYIEEESEK